MAFLATFVEGKPRVLYTLLAFVVNALALRAC